MRRGRLSEVWQPGEAGGWFIPVDPSKANAEWQKAQPPRTHRTKWLCVDCLKSFKAEYAGPEQRLRRCPSCAGQAVQVGVTFRPPKLTDLKGWKAALDFLETRTGRLYPDLAKRARAALAARRAQKRKG